MKILVATLNWGLGHTTRSVPLIDSFLNEGCEVILASDGRAGELLKSEFPKLQYFDLPSYGVNYNGSNFTRTILRQALRINRAIKEEKRVIETLVKENTLNVILSDNRFGCYNTTARSIFLSHQVNIITPSTWSNKIANHLNQKYIANFDEVWIPDFEKSPGMANELSHNHSFDSKYLGILSRMKWYPSSLLYDICIVLSGPEPKRTDLEEELIRQALQMEDKRIIIIQGKTDEPVTIRSIKTNLKIVSSMTTQRLNNVLLQSDLVVSRSGYSTIMDLYQLKKRALLIPTKGQTEQEYIANSLKKRAKCEIQYEGEINLRKAFNERHKYLGFIDINENRDLTLFVRQWMDNANHQSPNLSSNSLV